jgi:hypothetical protein
LQCTDNNDNIPLPCKSGLSNAGLDKFIAVAGALFDTLALGEEEDA